MTFVKNNYYYVKKKLFPICRSITGEGIKKSLILIKKKFPNLKIKKIKSKKKIFDWNVPPEWNVRDASIIDENGIKKGYVISKNEIQNAPIQSIEDLLEYAVNIDLRQRGIDGFQSDVSIRGGSFEQVLILINGIKINDPQTGHHSMNIPVSIQQIEKIEILTGGGTRIYGNYAYTGVINIITKKETTNSLLLASGENNFKSIEINGFHKNNNIKHSISILNKSSDGYIEGMDYKTNNLF